MTETLDRGEFVRLAYRLGLSRATGVLTVRPARGKCEVLVLRRGYLMASDTDARAAHRLSQLAALERASYSFDGGTTGYPPGAATRQLALAGWARRHLEGQIDSARAQELVRQLAGARITLRADLAPEDALCDDTDRRILAAMRVPRRLDQIWPLARTPRFRLLTFIHFLRQVGAVDYEGVGAPFPRLRADPHEGARKILGIDVRADKEAVKRAYRRLARALHPDLHPLATAERRRTLGRKFGEISAAYRELTGLE